MDDSLHDSEKEVIARALEALMDAYKDLLAKYNELLEENDQLRQGDCY